MQASTAACEVLEARSFKVAVDAGWAKSRQYGVIGVTTSVASGFGVVGAQPYETLVALSYSTDSFTDAHASKYTRS
jgi:predicted DsbA family dithiol-disulfide isomerase